MTAIKEKKELTEKISQTEVVPFLDRAQGHHAYKYELGFIQKGAKKKEKEKEKEKRKSGLTLLPSLQIFFAALPPPTWIFPLVFPPCSTVVFYHIINCQERASDREREREIGSVVFVCSARGGDRFLQSSPSESDNLKLGFQSLNPINNCQRASIYRSTHCPSSFLLLFPIKTRFRESRADKIEVLGGWLGRLVELQKPKIYG